MGYHQTYFLMLHFTYFFFLYYVYFYFYKENYWFKYNYIFFSFHFLFFCTFTDISQFLLSVSAALYCSPPGQEKSYNAKHNTATHFFP